jgi:MinD superfamily P-loop ATPase
LIITDGPPGVGCPVISTITGCDLVVIVTEPTLSAVHDLRRAVELCRHFRVSFGVIINKSDLNPDVADKIKEFCDDGNIPIWGEIPFDRRFTEAIRNSQPPVEYSSDIAECLARVWNNMEVGLYG